MPLTKIEEYLASAISDVTLLLAHLQFLDGQVALLMSSPVNGDQAPLKVVLARFASAAIESVEEDVTERESWPLDVIGFDCYDMGKEWRFVLNCGTVEWSWVSEWPSLHVQSPAT